MKTRFVSERLPARCVGLALLALSACAAGNDDVRKLIDAHRLDEALRLTTSRLERRPDEHRTRCLRAEVEVKLGLYDEASRDLERAIAVESADVDAADRAWTRYELGYLQLNFVGAVERAIASFDSALEIDPRHYKALEHRACAFAALSRHEQAVEDFTRALACWPEGEDVDDLQYSLRRCAASLRNLGRLAEAAEMDARAEARKAPRRKRFCTRRTPAERVERRLRGLSRAPKLARPSTDPDASFSSPQPTRGPTELEPQETWNTTQSAWSRPRA